VQPGKLAAFEVGGKGVAVANVGGTFHAFDLTTPARCARWPEARGGHDRDLCLPR
jgi:hypothetical protein